MAHLIFQLNSVLFGTNLNVDVSEVSNCWKFLALCQQIKTFCGLSNGYTLPPHQPKLFNFFFYFLFLQVSYLVAQKWFLNWYSSQQNSLQCGRDFALILLNRKSLFCFAAFCNSSIGGYFYSLYRQLPLGDNWVVTVNWWTWDLYIGFIFNDLFSQEYLWWSRQLGRILSIHETCHKDSHWQR